MIRVDYTVGDLGHELTITGHAGYSDHGNDIVCAGVSAIVFTLLGFLDNHPEDIGRIGAKVQSGNVHVRCVGGEKTSTAFDMAVIGLQQISMKYPENVRVTIHPAPAGDSREETCEKGA